MDEIIRKWPGKSPAGADGISHPAVYHMLDVAVVAERLIRGRDIAKPLADALVLLVALHDLGKIGVPFRTMLQSGQPQTAGSHWEVTEAYLRAFDAELLAPQLGSGNSRRLALYAASAGHHGRPPTRELHMRNNRPTGDWQKMLEQAGEGQTDARVVVKTFLDLWPSASLADMDTSSQVHVHSWQLAGLTTAADWIGSNIDWFPPTAPGLCLADYLAQARERAARAIEAAGLVAPLPRPERLFDFRPRPMQHACSEVPLPNGPTLAIIEDETGTGKTEAALILAQRMLRDGKGKGLYFALPTMATADAMFARVADVLLQMFDRAPSLALAHGRAALSERYRQLRGGRAHNPDEPGPNDWLADNRRRALLATVGVGTIDQALLAVVKAKHAALRLYGLSSKILIVDEVHEVGDPYMGQLLSTLLEVHAAQGGSAVLLSATIPLKLRANLMGAFARGVGHDSQHAVLSDTHYPAFTLSGASPKPIPAAPSARGPVRVERLWNFDSAIDLLADAAMRGAACVFVRNAVDEAINAVEALRARGTESDLLHARFTLHDRKQHEARVLGLYGKERGARPGRVLVATQVVESSLDLDFDVMVSDLAPMAALIQRAGRLWRHMDRRPSTSRSVETPILYVLSPDPEHVESEHWLKEVIGQGAYVYPAALQWRTARVLFDGGVIDAPAGLRALIEAAHGDDIAVPSVLERAELNAYGKSGAAAALAIHNRIGWSDGYRAGASAADDSDYPTRLGEPQRILVLARIEAGALVPWCGGNWGVETCQRSEVSASARRLMRVSAPEQTEAALASVRERLPEWLRASRIICPVADDGYICEGLMYRRSDGLRFI